VLPGLPQPPIGVISVPVHCTTDRMCISSYEICTSFQTCTACCSCLSASAAVPSASASAAVPSASASAAVAMQRPPLSRGCGVVTPSPVR